MSEEEVFVYYIPLHTAESNVAAKIQLELMLLRPTNIPSVSVVCLYDIWRQRQLDDLGLTMNARTRVPGTNWVILLVVAAGSL